MKVALQLQINAMNGLIAEAEIQTRNVETAIHEKFGETITLLERREQQLIHQWLDRDHVDCEVADKRRQDMNAMRTILRYYRVISYLIKNRIYYSSNPSLIDVR